MFPTAAPKVKINSNVHALVKQADKLQERERKVKEQEVEDRKKAT